MRRRHLAQFAPHCPVCARAGRGTPPLVLVAATESHGDQVLGGMLHCSAPACQHEYPILDGVPVIVPALRALLAERGAEALLRDDLDPALESLLGDALGPGSWFDVIRQVLSTYAWDGWADLDPAEAPADDVPRPGAARRCLARLLDLSGPVPAERVLDLGCAAGRTSFDLAEAHPEALVLGLDTNLALLRLAQGALGGMVSYPRRRIGLAYDRRRFRFAAAPEAAARVDFWACDAAALPFAPAAAELVVALNLLDCVPDPRALLAAVAAALRPGGRALLATPFDWSTRATPVEGWIGGHSQRAAHAGAAEPALRALLDGGNAAVPGLRLLREADQPWHTRLHERGAVLYRTHLAVAERVDG